MEFQDLGKGGVSGLVRRPVPAPKLVPVCPEVRRPERAGGCVRPNLKISRPPRINLEAFGWWYRSGGILVGDACLLGLRDCTIRLDDRGNNVPLNNEPSWMCRRTTRKQS